MTVQGKWEVIVWWESWGGLKETLKCGVEKFIKKEILGKIEEIDSLKLGGPVGRSLRVERDDLKRDFQELIRKENVSWSQKAKVKWAKEGNCNISFFNRVVSSRKENNHIGYLLLESGVRMSVNRVIEEEILLIFSKL